ncbi:uncharacterized protein I303_102651 [Kwoniella dejecticola CBS 10117]|uniref:Major facilitator superfamily (MFS) profile domain-containing protein n=1 Tax=Kwoniella dejecticola CBS 10117 TaxID=1296121 RepID=A0A1A6A9C0_9TREE|nr:uncharacterized protein I303_02665 [Kwoniella dejecticola CBS 10117]OBR86655.1 hypothetical protein I303_02665 [Kwoniella dejecticola CBS 10117]
MPSSPSAAQRPTVADREVFANVDPNSDDRTQIVAPVTNINDEVPPNERQPGKAEASEATASPTSPPYSSFSLRQKYLIIALASISATFSGFASNIYFPAIPTIARSLGTTESNINLTVTSYMVFQAISPTFWGAISDVYGRRLTLLCTFVVFLSACIGLALSSHFYQLIILRCLQSSGSASTIAIGAGMIGDITTREERGGYMGVFQAGLLAPLSIGPILGGIFADTLGWRSIFWFLAIYSGVYLVILALFLPETLRSIVGNGSIPPYKQAKAPFEKLVANRDVRSATSETGKKKKKLKIDFVAPIRILFEKEVLFVLLFLSIHYAAWQMTLTIQSSLFSKIYGLGEIDLGLTFIANGVGCMVGTLTTGKYILDKDYKKYKRKYANSNGEQSQEEDFPIEKIRMRTLWIWAPLQWISVIIFGWTIDKHQHISIPIIFSFFLAWSAMSIQSIITTFLVDIFPKQSASATAALNLARCLVGALATGVINPSIDRIGIGWSFTLWTGLMMASIALVGVQFKYGAGWRKKREQREKSKIGGNDA